MYSLELDVPPGVSRWVRLILLEHVHGVQMKALQPGRLGQTYRKAIMKEITSIESRSCEKNLSHRDIHLRNIIIRGLEDKDSSKLRIVIIDFGNADIGRSNDKEDPEAELELLPGTYISPILRWHSEEINPFRMPFEKWIDWDWENWLQEVYSDGIKGITPYMESVRWDFLQPDFDDPDREV